MTEDTVLAWITGDELFSLRCDERGDIVLRLGNASRATSHVVGTFYDFETARDVATAMVAQW